MSSASFLLALREGFEGALIVAIVLAFVKRGPRPEMSRDVWIGTLAALAVATVAGIVLQLTIDGLEGQARARTFAGICLAAAALLTWMIFWMRTHARHLKRELEGKAGNAVAESSGLALAMVAFTAVLREGLETALFLISAAAGEDPGRIIGGTLAGLVVAAFLGVLVYRGAHHFDMRRFFQVTGVLIIVFAAGLVSKAIAFLQGQTTTVVFNFKSVDLLTSKSEVGKFLIGIFGWDPAPSVLQFFGYWGYLLPALVFFFWESRQPKAPTLPAPEDVAVVPPAESPVPAAENLGSDDTPVGV